MYRSLRIYAYIMLSAVLLGTLVLLMNLLFMFRVNELSSIDSVVQKNIESGILYNGLSYGTIHNPIDGKSNLNEFSNRMYLATKPDITVIGSSTSFKFRDYFFNKSFYSLAGSITGPEDAFNLVDELFSKHPPKILIFNLDFWSPAYKNPYAARPHKGRQHIQPSRAKMIIPFSLFDLNILTLPLYFSILKGDFPIHVNGLEKVGFAAVVYDRGFSSDGSYFENLASPIDKTILKRSMDIFDEPGMINRWFKQGTKDAKVSVAGVHLLGQFKDEMNKLGTQVIFVAHPQASIFRNLLKKHRSSRRFIAEWRAQIVKELPKVIDLFDNMLGGSDCEFTDLSVHPGEVMTARMLREMAIQSNSNLKNFIDIKRLNSIINTYPGHGDILDNVVGRAYNIQERLIFFSSACD